MRIFKMAFTTIALLGVAMLTLTLSPLVVRASAIQMERQQLHSGQSVLNPNSIRSRNVSLTGMKQERTALAFAGFGLLVIGTILRIGRRVGEDQPTLTDSLVGHSHLPLAS